MALNWNIAGEVVETTADDLHIVTPAQKTLVLGTVVYDDLRVPLNAVKLGGSKDPTEVAYKGGLVYGFTDEAVGGNEKTVYFVAQMPHTYREGTAIVPHVHWVPEDNTAGDVRWSLTHSWANQAAAFPGETISVADCPAPAVADVHTYSELQSIDGTGMLVSSVLICALKRNSSVAGDTFDGKIAYLVEFDFHYEVDTLGSRQATIK